MRDASGAWWAGDSRMYDYDARRAQERQAREMAAANQTHETRLVAMESALGEILRVLRGTQATPTPVEKASDTKPVESVAPAYVAKHKAVCHTVGCKRVVGKPFTENGANCHRISNPTHDVR